MVSDDRLRAADAPPDSAVEDVRAQLRAEIAAISKEHEPDGFGYCLTCDPPAAYPCQPKWGADFALDIFDRRAAKNVPGQQAAGDNTREQA